jgi:hypothetical protein
MRRGWGPRRDCYGFRFAWLNGLERRPYTGVRPWAQRGKPKTAMGDNGTELTAKAILAGRGQQRAAFSSLQIIEERRERVLRTDERAEEPPEHQLEERVRASRGGRSGTDGCFPMMNSTSGTRLTISWPFGSSARGCLCRDCPSVRVAMIQNESLSTRDCRDHRWF